MLEKTALTLGIAAVLALLMTVLPVMGQGGDKHPKNGIATLYLRDAKLASFSFDTGGYGRSHRDSDVVTAGTQLDAGFLHKGHFTVGCRGYDKGRIIDLGDRKLTDTGLGRKNGVVEVRGKEYSIYHSLRLKSDKFHFKVAPYTNRWQILFEEPAGLFLPGMEHAKARIRAGHVYLVRITDKDGGEKILVKLRVLEYFPGDHVTFQWARLR
jgi:hypothetical protein